MASSQIETLDSDLKIKIDDIKNIIDIQINKRNQITESELKESLFIFVQIPENYIQDIEINAYSQQLMINSLECQNLEFNGKLSYGSIQDFKGTIEYDHNMDMLIECKSIDGAIEINQISATSKLIIPQDLSSHIIKKGIGNHIYYKDESINNELFDRIIELNGMKSELIIEKV